MKKKYKIKRKKKERKKENIRKQKERQFNDEWQATVSDRSLLLINASPLVTISHRSLLFVMNDKVLLSSCLGLDDRTCFSSGSLERSKIEERNAEVYDFN